MAFPCPTISSPPLLTPFSIYPFFPILPCVPFVCGMHGVCLFWGWLDHYPWLYGHPRARLLVTLRPLSPPHVICLCLHLPLLVRVLYFQSILLDSVSVFRPRLFAPHIGCWMRVSRRRGGRFYNHVIPFPFALPFITLFAAGFLWLDTSGKCLASCLGFLLRALFIVYLNYILKFRNMVYL